MAEKITPIIPKTAWVADTAVVRGRVTLGEHVSIWFGAVLRGDDAAVTVGENSNVQDGAVLHVSTGFPCMVGRNVTIGHRAIVHGCTVEDGALIGMGAIVLDGATIGTGAMVAAGAVVSPGTAVPSGTLAVGIPARVIGPLNDRQKEMRVLAAQNYLARKEAYRSGQY
ncbi:MAG: gamma carbonic anhydrase family protein [Chloroflexi bacterium]|nr:gamma carbonic anhydrase family protein [Chloroflexota bacterium]